MSLSENISSVIKSARELKKIADDLGNIELKSRLLDEIDKLQELRENLSSFGEDTQIQSQPFIPPAAPGTSGVPEGDVEAHVIQPSASGETYQIHIELDHDDDADEAAMKKESSSPEEDERLRLGELILRQLEPRHQQVLQKMNDILTEDQKILKQTLTREGQAAGKSANQIQQEVMAALGLTNKQHQLLAIARKELHDIRTKIAHEVDGLLTTDQRKRLQRKIHKEYSANK